MEDMIEVISPPGTVFGATLPRSLRLKGEKRAIGSRKTGFQALYWMATVWE
jgi:hypothetical protein